MENFKAIINIEILSCEHIIKFKVQISKFKVRLW